MTVSIHKGNAGTKIALTYSFDYKKGAKDEKHRFDFTDCINYDNYA